MGKEVPMKDFASFTGGEGDPGQLLEEAQKIAAAYDGRNESAGTASGYSASSCVKISSDVHICTYYTTARAKKQAQTRTNAPPHIRRYPQNAE